MHPLGQAGRRWGLGSVLSPPQQPVASGGEVQLPLGSEQREVCSLAWSTKNGEEKDSSEGLWKGRVKQRRERACAAQRIVYIAVSHLFTGGRAGGGLVVGGELRTDVDSWKVMQLVQNKQGKTWLPWDRPQALAGQAHIDLQRVSQVCNY